MANVFWTALEVVISKTVIGCLVVWVVLVSMVVLAVVGSCSIVVLSIISTVVTEKKRLNTKP